MQHVLVLSIKISIFYPLWNTVLVSLSQMELSRNDSLIRPALLNSFAVHNRCLDKKPDFSLKGGLKWHLLAKVYKSWHFDKAIHMSQVPQTTNRIPSTWSTMKSRNNWLYEVWLYILLCETRAGVVVVSYVGQDNRALNHEFSDTILP